MHAVGKQLPVGGVRTTTWRFLCRDGSYRWCEATSRRITAESQDLIVSTVRDIENRRNSEETLERRAFTDPLTGVANRTVLMDRLHQALLRLDRGTGLLVVFYLDLDRFKVSTTRSDTGWRHVLSKMAERLTHHLRPADSLPVWAVTSS